MSFALTLTGKSNPLEAYYSPTIDLEENYEIGLILLETFNSIPNITSENNCFYYDSPQKIIRLPEGAYEISDIAKFLKKKLLENSGEPEKVEFTLVGNNSTLRSEIYSSYNIDFSAENNIGSILGFDTFLPANKLHESSKPVSIVKVNTVQVICNISSGAYTNNHQSHSIYEFGINVSPGYRISEVPHKVIYFPIIVKSLCHLSLQLVDQDNNNVNFRQEQIVVRVHLRKCR